jgi:hypothetical protein
VDTRNRWNTLLRLDRLGRSFLDGRSMPGICFEGQFLGRDVFLRVDSNL